MRDDGSDVGRVRDVRNRSCGSRLERGISRAGSIGVEDDDDGRLRDANLGLEQRLCPCRFEIGVDEPSGTQRARRLERKRNRQADEREPRDDDRAAVAGAPSPEALEAVHRRAVMLAACYDRPRP